MERLYRTLSISIPTQGIVDPAVVLALQEIEKQLRVIFGQTAGAPADSYTDGTILTDALADNAVTSVKIKDGEVKEADIDTGAVTVTKLGAEAVETAKIKLLNVTEGTLAASAVAQAKVKSTKATTAGAAAAGAITPVGPFAYMFYPDIHFSAITMFLGGAVPVGAPNADAASIYINNIAALGAYSISHRTVDA